MGKLRHQKLWELIDSDRKQGGTSDRYPSRFVFLAPTKDLFSDLSTLSSRYSAKIVKLSNYLEKPDFWASWSSIREKLIADINASLSDILVFGFSEYLRPLAFKDVEKIVVDVAGLEASSVQREKQIRVFFACDSMQQTIRDVLKTDLVRSTFYSPIIDLMSSEAIESKDLAKVFIDNQASMGKAITQPAGYLDLPILITPSTSVFTIISKPLLSLFAENKDYLSDHSFPYNYLVDSEAIIRQKVPSLTMLLKWMDDDTKDYLASLLKQENEPFLMDIFSLAYGDMGGEEPEEFFLKKLFSPGTSSIDRKMSQLFFMTISDQELPLPCYLDALGFLGESFSPEAAIISIYLRFSEEQFIENFKTERKNLIDFLVENKWFGYEPKQMGLDQVLDKAWNSLIHSKRPFASEDFSLTKDYALLVKKYFSADELEELVDEFTKKYCLGVLTTGTLEERQLIIKLASIGILRPSQIETLYPLLYDYLDLNFGCDIPEDQKNFKKYLSAYIYSKLGNEPTEEFINLLQSDFASNSETFYKWYYTASLSYDSGNISPVKVYVLDGVGAEYLWFIAHLIERKTDRIPFEMAMRATHLPSITSINRDFLTTYFTQITEYTWLQDYDTKVIHGDFYRTTQNVEKSLRIIDQMVDQILKDVGDASFAITADHGSTVTPKIISKKINNAFDAEHEGRCCKASSTVPVSEANAHGYLQYKTEDGQIWYLAFAENSLGSTPKRECHGGASPEEVLVPWIAYTAKGDFHYSLIPIKSSVSGINPNIIFKLQPLPPKPETVYVIDGVGQTITTAFENTLFTAKLSTGQKQTVFIYVDGQKIRLEVGSDGGLKDNMEDLFS